MLEIFAVYMLCKGNRQRALDRGKSGGVAIAYTLVLWIGMEFLGALIGVYIFGVSFAPYLLALGFAAIGGVISWLISKSGTSEVPDVSYYFELSPPATLHIYRDDSNLDRIKKYYITLNDEELGFLDNDSMLTTFTSSNRNLITFRAENKKKEKDSYVFDAISGETMDIHLDADGFIGKQAQPSYIGSNQNNSYVSEEQYTSTVFCPECGTQQNANSNFCVNCGSNLKNS